MRRARSRACTSFSLLPSPCIVSESAVNATFKAFQIKRALTLQRAERSARRLPLGRSGRSVGRSGHTAAAAAESSAGPGAGALASAGAIGAEEGLSCSALEVALSLGTFRGADCGPSMKAYLGSSSKSLQIAVGRLLICFFFNKRRPK